MTKVSENNKGAITQQLIKIKSGDEKASENLYALVYNQLLNIAGYQLNNERADHTFNRTDLVHESFLKLVNLDEVDWQDRRHFFRTSAKAMRNILIDHARKKISQKRGNRPDHIPINEEVLQISLESDSIIRLDEALDELRQFDEKLAEIVDLRFFAGLSMDDISTMTGVSLRTVNRNWAKARGWLYEKMNSEGI